MAKPRGNSRIKKNLKKKKNGKGSQNLLKKKKPVKIANAVPAICSECYGDFFLSSNPKKENITCPTCGHVGIVEDGSFEEISQRRQEQKKNFIIAFLLNALALVFILIWGLANSWPFANVLGNGTVTGSGETTSMVLLGGAIVLLLAGLFMIVKYEKSRVDVYF